MKKSFVKRIRITTTGKIIRRRMAVDHFRTRKSTKNLRRKRRSHSLDHKKRTILRLRY